MSWLFCSIFCVNLIPFESCDNPMRRFIWMCLSICVYYYKWVLQFKVEMVSNSFTMDYNDGFFYFILFYFFLSCDYNKVKGLKKMKFLHCSIHRANLHWCEIEHKNQVKKKSIYKQNAKTWSRKIRKIRKVEPNENTK